MYSFRNTTEKNTYLNFISNNYTRTPKSKIVVFDELGSEEDGTTYYGTTDLVTFPKTEHTTTQLIGGFPAKTCEFEIYNRSGTVNLNGKEVAVYRGLDINGTIIWVSMGIFKAEDADIKTNINKRSISFKGTDRTRLFERKYTNPVAVDSSGNDILTSKTLKWLAEQICARNGVTLKGSLPLASLTIHERPNADETTTDRQMLGYIAEINGCIAMIDRDGELIFKKPASVAVAAAISKTKYKALSYEKTYGPVNTVYLGREGYEDTYHYPESLPSGTEEIKWVIKDNPIVDLDRTWWLNANRVPSQLIGASMIPFEVTELIDDYIYDLGDIVTITDKNGNDVDITILSIVNTSRIKSTLKAETPTGHEAEKALSGSLKESVNYVKFMVDHVNNEIISLAANTSGQYSELRQNYNSLNSAVFDPVTGQSRITQVANSISLEVSNAVNALTNNILIDSEACFENSTGDFSGVDLVYADSVETDISFPSGKARKFRLIGVTADGGVSFSPAETLIGTNTLKKDTVYTFSFYVYAGNPLEFNEKYLIVYAGNELANADIISKDLTTSSTGNKRCSITFRTNSTPDKLVISFKLKSAQSTVNMQISSLQLEEGDTATTWMPNVLNNKFATRAELTVLDNSIVGRIEDSLDGGICTSVTLDHNGLTVENGALTIKDANDQITIAAGKIQSDKIDFGTWENLAALSGSGSGITPISQSMKNIISEAAGDVSGLASFYNADSSGWYTWANATDTSSDRNKIYLNNPGSSITIYRDRYYVLNFKYIVVSKTSTKYPTIDIFFDSADEYDALVRVAYTDVPDEIKDSDDEFKYYVAYGEISKTVLGEQLLNSDKTTKEISTLTEVGVMLNLFNVDVFNHYFESGVNIVKDSNDIIVQVSKTINGVEHYLDTLEFGNDCVVAFKDFSLKSFEGSSLSAGAIMNYGNDCFLDFMESHLNCKSARIGRVETTFESWGGAVISTANRDVIRSDGGLVVSANYGANDMILDFNHLKFNTLKASSKGANWRYLIYNTSTGEIRSES